MKIQARIGDVLPEHIVELASYANMIDIKNKTVVFEDKGLYNNFVSIVDYYKASKDKNCPKAYKRFSDIVYLLNDLLAQYRVGLMKSSLSGNPFMIQPFVLDKI